MNAFAESVWGNLLHPPRNQKENAVLTNLLLCNLIILPKRIYFKPSSGEKSKDTYIFLGKGVKLDSDNYPVIAIAIVTKPDTIRYAIMLQACMK